MMLTYLGVGKNLIGLLYDLEQLLCSFWVVRVLVWMKLEFLFTFVRFCDK